MLEVEDSVILEYCKGFSVLVVEDVETLLLQYRITLEGVFAEIVTATDGEEGLKAFHEGDFDLLISDHYMPRMRGLELLKKISEEGSATPTILATSADESEILIEAVNLNISHFLLKPWSKPKLINAIVHALRPYVIQKQLEEERRKHLELLELQKKYVESQQHQGFEKEFQAIRNDYYYNFVTHPEDPSNIWFLDSLYKAHDILNGDAYSMRKLNEHQTFVFIVDAMGKGIQASLTSIVSSSFLNYLSDKAIREKRFDLSRVIQEYIDFINYNLLEDEMVSIMFGLFNMKDGGIEYASFSMPPMLLHKDDGTIEKLRSNNPPLTSYTQTFDISRSSFANVKKLLLCSDGLTECATDEGGLYMQHIQQDFLRSNNLNSFIELFREKVHTVNDDITLLYFYNHQLKEEALTTLTLRSTQKEIDRSIELFSRFLQEADVDIALSAKLSLVFTELVTNAYEHGSLGITQDEKRRFISEGSLPAEHQRREKLYHDKKITVDYRIDSQSLILRICDQGEGFDTQSFKKLLSQQQKVHGRGFQISTHIVDTINYSKKGNCVIIQKELKRNRRGTSYR